MSASVAAACAVPAAVCRPRTAAARRVLATLLFLGGFLVLAFAFGGGAQAAEHAGDAARSSDGLLTSEPGGQKDGARAESRLADRSPQLTPRRPAARGLGGRLAAVVERTSVVARPVGEAVHGVVGSAGLRDFPGRLGLGASHGGPGGDTDGHDGPGGPPAAAAPTGGCPAHAPRDRIGADTDWPRAQANRSSVPGAASAAGHRTDANDAAPGGPGGPGGHDDDGVPGVPAAPLPGEQPPALLAPAPSAYAGDGQDRRGGPHEHSAVLPSATGAVPLRSGAPPAADRAPTRERSGEIPRFPG